MKPKKSVVVLIVAVILLMSGGIAAAFIFSSPTTVGSGEEHLSDTIKAGDYYEVSVKSDASESTASYLSRSEFFEWIYTVEGLNDKLHSKELTVNGVKVKCDCYYQATDTGKKIYFVDPNADAEHARTYGYEVYEGEDLVDSRYLVSTNFALDKRIDEQSMYEGETMSYITSDSVSNKICPAASLIMECTVKQTVGKYDAAQIKWAVSVDTVSHDSKTARTTVQEYIVDSKGDTVVTTDGKILDRDEYLMTVDYNEFLTYIKNTGAVMTRGIPVSKTIDTVYGQRDVTEETITIFGAFNAKYTIDFGSDYVIYSITEEKNGQEGSTVTSVTSCSFMYEGTKEVYGAQFSVTLDSFTIAVIVIAAAVLVAIVVGRLVFNMIYHKTEKI